MSTARESAVRLLQLMMIASLVLPAALFAYASWLSYRDIHDVADERIVRSLDVMQEQGLRVFETVERTFAEVNEIVRGMSDDEIHAAQSRLHSRLQLIVGTMPQLDAIVLVGRDGRPLVASNLAALPDGVALDGRDYFQAQLESDAGTYVSGIETVHLPGLASDFFTLSHRLESPNGPFNGIIAIAVRPSYFDDFYGMVGATPGSFHALLRADGSYLARYPRLRQRSRRLTDESGFHKAVARGLKQGIYTVNSEIDGLPRRIGFRKLAGYPVYALAGVSNSALRAAWFSTMKKHLSVGLPATFLVFAVLWIALRRTRRLYEEADRREAAEGALRQAQRLEAIGQLTGGVAHDFNNLLMIISGSVHQLRREVVDDQQRRALDAIAVATQRGESLTRQLLAFSRRQMLQPGVLDLAARLPEIKEMLSRSLRDDVEIRVGVPRSPCLVKVDPSEFELALLNLAVNARDAMPSGGTLTLTAKPSVLRGKPDEEGLSGDFIAVTVADTGAGIAPDLLPRVFEPYFTTKEMGKGTGLGLSQVYGFARQSGGAAKIVSAPRQGTAVTLFLPQSFESPLPTPEPCVAAVRPTAAGTALLLEDNAEVAQIARSYLHELGYTVKQVAGAHAGLELIERAGGIDLVFSDVLMPGMNGLDLAEILHRRFPGIVVLLTTGYDSSAQDARRLGFEVLQKPYDLTSLEHALRTARGAVREATATARRQAAPQPERFAG